MDILRQNTTPSFEIVPRKKLDTTRVFKFKLINEFTQISQNILADVTLLQNQNYLITMRLFPDGNISDKFSYTIIDNLSNEIVSLGKLIILNSTENIQDYSKKSTNKFYK